MKYIKLFEKITNIKKGDYVLLYYSYIPIDVPQSAEVNFKEYFNNTIGKVVRVSSLFDLITIYYEDTEPVKSMFTEDKHIIVVPDEYVRYIGSSPEDIELQKEIDTYNL